MRAVKIHIVRHQTTKLCFHNTKQSHKGQGLHGVVHTEQTVLSVHFVKDNKLLLNMHKPYWPSTAEVISKNGIGDFGDGVPSEMFFHVLTHPLLLNSFGI